MSFLPLSSPFSLSLSICLLALSLYLSSTLCLSYLSFLPSVSLPLFFLFFSFLSLTLSLSRSLSLSLSLSLSFSLSLSHSLSLSISFYMPSFILSCPLLPPPSLALTHSHYLCSMISQYICFSLYLFVFISNIYTWCEYLIHKHHVSSLTLTNWLYWWHQTL